MGHVRDDGAIVTVIPPRELTDEIVASILKHLQARLERGGSYSLVFDLSEAGTPNASQRQLLARHMRKNKALIQRWVITLAAIAPSATSRGVLTAIFWIEPPPVRHQVFSSAKEALAWTHAALSSKVRS